MCSFALCFAPASPHSCVGVCVVRGSPGAVLRVPDYGPLLQVLHHASGGGRISSHGLTPARHRAHNNKG